MAKSGKIVGLLRGPCATYRTYDPLPHYDADKNECIVHDDEAMTYEVVEVPADTDSDDE